jgi:hypothetical protein
MKHPVARRTGNCGLNRAPDVQITDRENIQRFVRQVLGCECPEEVFKHIEGTCSIPLDNGIILRGRLNIGNRLLIYIVMAQSSAFVKEALPELVRTGMAERDRKGFNRFRLVLASDDRKRIEDIAERTFNSLLLRDEKVHFHVVEMSALSFLGE